MIGLCGAVHTGIARQIRNELNAKTDTEHSKIICVGDKSRAVLQRLFAKKFIFVANEVGVVCRIEIDENKHFHLLGWTYSTNFLGCIESRYRSLEFWLRLWPRQNNLQQIPYCCFIQSISDSHFQRESG